MVSIKLCKDGENDEYIILCNFGGCIASSFGVIEVDLWIPPPPPAPESEKKPSLNRVNVTFISRSPCYKWGGVPTMQDISCKVFTWKKARNKPASPPVVWQQNWKKYFPSFLSFALLYSSGWRMCPYLCWRNVFVYLGRLISVLFSLIK